MADMAHVPDRSHEMTRLCIAMIVIPTVAVGLRFWGRAISPSGRFWWDDWFALLSLMCSWALSGLLMYWATIGLGKHTADVSPYHQERGSLLLFAGYFPFDIGVFLPKTSALFFYQRIFDLTSPRFRIAIWIGHGLTVAWILYAIFSITFQCVPVEKTWIPTKPGHCINQYAWYLSSGIWDACMDIYVLVLPLPLLAKLRMKLKRKLLILGVFVFGYCAVVVSVGRLIAIGNKGEALIEDFTWNSFTVLLWTELEIPISTVSVCLPSCFSFFKRWSRHGTRSLFTSKDFQSLSSSDWAETETKTVRPAPHSHPVSQALHANPGVESTAEVETNPSLSSDASSLPSNFIKVRTDYGVEVEQRV